MGCNAGKQTNTNQQNTSLLNNILLFYEALYIQHFNKQLKHTTLKNIELLKHFKISKIAPKISKTVSVYKGNRHQGAIISTYLKIIHLYMFRTRGFIFRKTVICTLWYNLFTCNGISNLLPKRLLILTHVKHTIT